MSLGTKTLLGLGLSFSVWSALLYTALAWLLRPSFHDLEQRAIERNCHRASDAVHSQLEGITSKVGDWSLWDDTWNFIATRDPEYIKANLNPESLVTLQLDFMVFVDGAGTIVHEAFVDAEGNAATAPFACAQLLRDEPRLLQHNDALSCQQGLVERGGRLFLLASRPIHRSDRSGERRGTMLAGREFNAARLQELAELTHQKLELRPASTPTKTIVVARKPDQITAITPLTGLGGRPVVDLAVTSAREIHAEGEQALRLMLIALLASCGLALATTLLGVDGAVLRPLRRIHAVVREIAASGDLSRKVALGGNDEIGDLARSFNTLTDRLAGTQSELLHANQARTQFLANVSHEVRTPVTALIGFADLLLDPALTPHQREDFVRTIARNGRHLLAILNDLLDSAKLESGHMGIELLPTDPLAMVQEVVATMRPAALGKGLQLLVEQRTPLPAQIATDPTRLRQILGNLLGNAIKFTAQGRVRVAVGMDGPETIRFDIADTGIGIAAPAMARLFEPFAQADTSTSRCYGGTGLGLMLSRNLARRLGGDVTVQSEPGKGSTFSATVATGPLAGVATTASLPAMSTTSAPPPRSSAGRPLTGERILVVDDAADNRRLVSFVLRRAGADVVTADDGQQAIDVVGSAADELRPFDLVVMDMQMPVLDGYAATRELRRRGCTAPIVALTASAMAGDREQCLQAGCTDYATKPIDQTQLIERIHVLLATGAKHA